jgi:hypothetical protein
MSECVSERPELWEAREGRVLGYYAHRQAYSGPAIVWWQHLQSEIMQGGDAALLPPSRLLPPTSALRLSP